VIVDAQVQQFVHDDVVTEPRLRLGQIERQGMPLWKRSNHCRLLSDEKGTYHARTPALGIRTQSLLRP
jgi:hypothetical protein